MSHKETPMGTKSTPMSKVIYADYDSKEGRKVVREKLMELPFFRKYEAYSDITFDMLEKALAKIQEKYPVCVGYIMQGGRKIPNHYSFMLKTIDDHQHLSTVYSRTLREGMEKSIIYLYHYSRVHYKEE